MIVYILSTTINKMVKNGYIVYILFSDSCANNANCAFIGYGTKQFMIFFHLIHMSYQFVIIFWTDFSCFGVFYKKFKFSIYVSFSHGYSGTPHPNMTLLVEQDKK